MHKNEEKIANYLKESINCCTFVENFKIYIIMKQETREKLDELKELVSTLDNQRADFWDEDADEFIWDGEEIESWCFKIFTGNSWDDYEEVSVTSIYVEDDQLYFNLFRQAFTFKGNTRGSEEIDHFEPEFVLDRFWEESQEDTFIDDLGFFISLIKGELE